jgi:hypothetical protein
MDYFRLVLAQINDIGEKNLDEPLKTEISSCEVFDQVDQEGFLIATVHISFDHQKAKEIC